MYLKTSITRRDPHCIKNNVTSNFGQFCLANRDLQDISAYRQCLQKLPINKKRRVRLVKKDLSSVKNELMFNLKWIDFHVCNIFFVGNDRSISEHQNIQDKNICELS